MRRAARGGASVGRGRWAWLMGVAPRGIEWGGARGSWMHPSSTRPGTAALGRGRGRLRGARPVPPRFTDLRGLGRKSARPGPPGVLGCGRLLCKSAVNAWRGVQTPSPVNQVRGSNPSATTLPTAEGPRRPLRSGRGMKRPRNVAAEWSPSSGCCAAGLPPGGQPRRCTPGPGRLALVLGTQSLKPVWGRV